MSGAQGAEPLAHSDVAKQRLSPGEIRLKHARHLEELTERGANLAHKMFDSAGDATLEEPRRIQYVRLADRLSETTRKLILTHEKLGK